MEEIVLKLRPGMPGAPKQYPRCPKCGERAPVVLAQDRVRTRRIVVVCMACKRITATGEPEAKEHPEARNILDLACEHHGVGRGDLLMDQPGVGCGGFKIIHGGAGVRLWTRRGEKIFRLGTPRAPQRDGIGAETSNS